MGDRKLKTYYSILIYGSWSAKSDLWKYLKTKDTFEEEVIFLIKQFEEIVNEEPDSIYTYDIESFIDSVLSNCDTGNVLDAIINSKLLSKISYTNSRNLIPVLNKAIETSKNAVSYIDLIKKNYPQYDNYPLIILNKNISSEDRIKILKKTYIQKNESKYLTALKNGLDDFAILDDYITATITENNRIKEKTAATRNTLEKFLFGSHNINRCYSNVNVSSLFTKAANTDLYFAKYGNIFSPSYLNSIYSTKRYSEKNTNIKDYFSMIVDREKDSAKKLQLLSEAPNLASRAFNNILHDLNERITAENVDFTEFSDQDLIKGVLKYKLAQNNSIFFSGYSTSIFPTYSLTKAINTYFDIFEPYLKKLSVELLSNTFYSSRAKTVFDKTKTRFLELDDTPLNDKALSTLATSLFKKNHISYLFLIPTNNWQSSSDILTKYYFFKEWIPYLIEKCNSGYTETKKSLRNMINVIVDNDFKDAAINAYSSISKNLKNDIQNAYKNEDKITFDNMVDDLFSILKSIEEYVNPDKENDEVLNILADTKEAIKLLSML